MIGEYGAKDMKLANYNNLVKEQREKVPQKKNKEADVLANSKQSSEVLDFPNISLMAALTVKKGWKDPIMEYLTNSSLPKDSYAVREIFSNWKRAV